MTPLHASHPGPRASAQLQTEEETVPGLPRCVVATVPRGTGDGQFNMADHVPKQAMRTQGVDFIAFALAAASEALASAGWGDGSSLPKLRAGVSLGSGIGSIDDTVQVAQALAPGGAGARRVSPFFVPRMLVNMACGHVSMRWGLRGPTTAPSTACATGAHAIGDAFRCIAFGDADVMLAGGTEACVSPIALSGFSRARALSTTTDPAAASRPFVRGRDGFVLGEGAGVLVLEEAEAAAARGAPVLAEVGGFGMSGDAHHITLPLEDGSGASLAMAAAAARGGLHGQRLGYINAHATSTPQGDVIEARGVARFLADLEGGDVGPAPLLGSTKGNIGHLLGAAGAVEAAVAVLSLHHRTVPGTANLTPESLDEAVAEALQGAAAMATAAPGGHALPDGASAVMSNSFGFGGTNASLLFTSPRT